MSWSDAKRGLLKDLSIRNGSWLKLNINEDGDREAAQTEGVWSPLPSLGRPGYTQAQRDPPALRAKPESPLQRTGSSDLKVTEPVCLHWEGPAHAPSPFLPVIVWTRNWVSDLTNQKWFTEFPKHIPIPLPSPTQLMLPGNFQEIIFCKIRHDDLLNKMSIFFFTARHSQITAFPMMEEDKKETSVAFLILDL